MLEPMQLGTLGRPHVSRLDALRAIHEAMRQAAVQAAFDARVRAVESMISVIEGETIEAFRDAQPHEVAQRALELGKRQWKSWAAAAELGLHYADEMGIETDAIMRGPVIIFQAIAEKAEVLLPRMGPEGRQHARAIGFLYLGLLPFVPLEEAMKEAAEIFALPVNEVIDEAIIFFTLLEAIGIFGVNGAVPSATLDVIARQAWGLLSANIEVEGAAEIVEVAWESALAAEGRLEDGAPLSLDSYLASTRTAQ